MVLISRCGLSCIELPTYQLVKLLIESAACSYGRYCDNATVQLSATSSNCFWKLSPPLTVFMRLFHANGGHNI